MPSKTDDDLVWHYTDSFGLKGIVETHTLRAGALNELNDANELEEGRQRFVRAVEQVKHLHKPEDVEGLMRLIGTPEATAELAASTYSVSASKNPDNLSLWRYYGGEASYAIGLDSTKKLHPFTEPATLIGVEKEEEVVDEDEYGRPIYDRSPHLGAFDTNGWEAVSYNPSDETIETMIQLLLPDDKAHFNLTQIMFSTMKFLHLGAHKHKSFEAEEEVRMMYQVTPEDAFVLFRATHKGLRHHIRVAHLEEGPTHTVTVDDSEYELFDCIVDRDRLPIKEIRLSPNGHRNSAKDTLEAFLKAHDYEDVEVSSSASPYIA